jgi:DNA-binding NarL/FixJ family response regulator
MGESPTTIVILDRNEIARRGLRALFHSHPGLQVIADAATAQEVTPQIIRFQPDVLVMDPVLPDASGFEVCQQLRARAPDLRVVVLVSRVEERVVVAAVRAGATSVLSKRAPLDDICRAVRAAAAGEPLLDAPATAALLGHVRRQHAPADAGEALTDVERRVLRLVVDGRTNREIGQTLSLGEKTVKTHLARAFAKLHVTRRAQAAVLFVSEENGVGGAGGRTDAA